MALRQTRHFQAPDIAGFGQLSQQFMNQGAATASAAIAGFGRRANEREAQAAQAAREQQLLEQQQMSQEGTYQSSLGSFGHSRGDAQNYQGGEYANSLRDKLMQRGLPQHIAEGFVMNFRDESGLNPGINEQNPMVPGSRGGFGLYQLTGPRRVAYENYARQRGVSFDNDDAQLDFMMYELQGPESNAMKHIMSAQDRGQAAAAIVNKFLRPAEQHRTSRVARYMGNAGYGSKIGR